ncbi:MAG: hypothetical protein AAF211_25340, partial [Myxococcota bacterium]
MIEITGQVLASDTQLPREGVAARVSGSIDGSSDWVLLVTGPASDSTGAYSVLVPDTSTYPYGRIEFVDESGVALTILQSNVPLVFPFTAPPEVVDITFRVALLVAQNATEDAALVSVTGSVVDNQSGLAGQGMEVRLVEPATGAVIASEVTWSDGTFVLPVPSNAGSLGVEFGPSNAPNPVASGTVAWGAGEAPLTFDYRVDVPLTLPEADNGPVQVSGSLRLVDGSPLQGGTGLGRPAVRVTVYRVQIGQADTVLGSFDPEADGRLPASASVTAPAGGMGAKFQAEIQPVSAGAWEPLGEPVLVPKVRTQVQVDLVVQDDRLVVTSDAEVSDPVELMVDATVPSLAWNDVTEDDILLLSKKLSIHPQTVALRVVARRLRDRFATVSPAVIDVHVFFALLKTGVPQRPGPFAKAVSDRSSTEVRLKRAVAQRYLLQSKLDDAGLSDLLDDLAGLHQDFDRSLAQPSLASLVRVASENTELSNSEIQQFVDRWHEVGP